MKIFSKTIAVVLSAFVILLCAVPAASAAQTAPCPSIQVIRCEGADCADIEKLMDQFCNGCGVCPNDILKTVKEYCPDGNCCISVPDIPAQQPTEAPSAPAQTPAKPSDPPTAPIVVPTEAVETPSEQVEFPTEPVVKPTEPAAPAQPESAEFNTAYEAEVLRLVNIERAKNGLSPLTMDDGAVKVAHLRAKEIVQNFSHTRPDGSSCFTAANAFGVSYRTAGENIAYGYATPEQVVNGWMNSDGHRKNILSASFTKIGIGCYESRGVLYWSQFFIG